MPTNPIEFILARQLAEYLSTPMAIVDANGKTVYYNEPCEYIFGKKYNESGDIENRDWENRFYTVDDRHSSLAVLDIPFVSSLSNRVILQGEYWMRNFEEIEQKVLVICIPIVSMGHRELGTIVYFNLTHRS
ncbi:MAG: PAS domain-containing protein [Saprospiraceae bacterium]